MLVFFAGALPSLDGAPMLELVRRCQRPAPPSSWTSATASRPITGPFASYLPYVNLVVNSEEGRRITGKETPREMLRCAWRRWPAVPRARSSGRHQSRWRVHDVAVDGTWEYLDVPRRSTAGPSADVVGAGDAFRAGLAAYISHAR